MPKKSESLWNKVVNWGMWVVGCELVGVIGVGATRTALPVWYAQLVKPNFVPPGWVFALVWIFLYALMGSAASLVWAKRKTRRGVSEAIAIFGVQLILNLAWVQIFFGLRNIEVAFVVILALVGTILFTMAKFSKIDGRAYMLMVPYVMWVGFAAFLNLAIGLLNG